MPKTSIVAIIVLFTANNLFPSTDEHKSTTRFSRPKCKAATQRYNDAVEKAYVEFREKIQAAQNQYVNELQELLRQVVADENFTEAAAIKNEIAKYKPRGVNTVNDINDGLVLYLSFDKVDGEQVLDQSGKGNHGVLKGGTLVPGRIGNALQCQFENKVDGVLVKDNDSLDLKEVTATAWIKTDHPDEHWNRIVDKDWRTAYDLCLGGKVHGHDSQHSVFFETAGASVGPNRSATATDVVDGKWHFVAGSSDGQVLTIYIDGKRVGTHRLKRARKMRNNTCDLMIGNTVAPYDPPELLYFDGLIDEVRLYGRVLSDAEIDQLYRLK